MIFELLYVDPSRSRKAAPADQPKNPGKRYLGFLENIKAESKSETGKRLLYSNPETGVEAAFVAYPPECGDEIGLAFEMELPRPTFFALEAIPAALAVARDKKLAVEILDEDGSRLYERPSFEDLLKEWRHFNSKAVNANGRTLHKGCAEGLESMWEFSILRRDLARRYNRGRVQVPELYTVIHKRTKRIGRMVDWDGLEKVALGESDWVRLVDPPKPLKNGAIYETELLVGTCKPLLRRVPQPISHHLCDKARARTELVDKLASLKSVTMRSFEEVSFDEIYDEQGIAKTEH